ncbi:MAG: T9SS type A sorting domain-containing protein, partial [Bacteroidota bacterium]
TTEDLTSLVAGNYDVTVTDGNGCSATLSNTVNSVVGIEEKNNEFGFALYPNPSNGQFVVTLTNPNSNNSIQVFDVLGKKIFETNNNGSSTKINLNERNGVYLVKITNGNNTYVERVILKK